MYTQVKLATLRYYIKLSLTGAKLAELALVQVISVAHIIESPL